MVKVVGASGLLRVYCLIVHIVNVLWKRKDQIRAVDEVLDINSTMGWDVGEFVIGGDS